MNSLVNDKIIASFLNENNFNNELKKMLNLIIDEELEKEPDLMDCDLIDECTNMLIELEQNDDDGFAVIVPLINSNAIMKACEGTGIRVLSRGVRASLIACIMLVSLFTANTAIAEIFDYNIAQEVAQAVSTKLIDWGIISKRTLNEDTPLPPSDNTQAPENDNEPKPDVEEIVVPEKAPPATYAPTPSLPVISTATGGNKIEELAGEDDDEEEEEPPSPPSIAPSYNFKLTLDANGGFCPISSINVTYGRTIGELPVPTREGYEFIGWYNSKVKSGNTKVTKDTTYKLKSDATLTARWAPYTYVTLNANGGECEVDRVRVSIYNPTNEPLPIPTREGYTFYGWFYDYSIKFTTTEGLEMFYGQELVAIWVANGEEFTLTFNAQSGSCNIKNKKVIYGQPIGELPVPTRSDNWKFAGWYTGPSMIYDRITEDTPYEYVVDTTIYALYYTMSATVTFDANGGECDVESKTVYSRNVYGKMPQPTREGYNFLGWSNGFEYVYEATELEYNIDDHTLIAEWMPQMVQVRFDANGGRTVISSDTITTQNYYYMTEYMTFPKVAREGHEFVGWFTEPEGGEQITERDLCSSTKSPTFYAHWRENENICIVTVHTAYSDSGTNSYVYNKGDKLGNISVKSQILYDFIGLYDKENYGERVTGSYIVTGDTELWANYVLKRSTTTLTLITPSDYYELNDVISLEDLSILITVKNTTSSSTITGDMLVEGNALLDYDTSHYGESTVSVKFYTGLVLYEASKQITISECSHSSGTHIESYIAPTCGADGYAGTTVCDICGDVLDSGTTIPRLGHKSSTVTTLINASEPTCTSDGYTGDTVCCACGEVLKKGAVIPACAHNTQTTIIKATCNLSGRITEKCIDCGNIVKDEVIPYAYAYLEVSTFQYTGEAITPAFKIKTTKGNINTAFTVLDNASNTEPGNYRSFIRLDNEYYDGTCYVDWTIRPPAITTLQATPGRRSISLSWTTPYQTSLVEVKWENRLGQTETIGLNGGTTSCTITDLYSYLPHTVRIRQFVDGAASDWSEPITVTVK